MAKSFRGRPLNPRVMSAYQNSASYAFTHVFLDGDSVGTRTKVSLVLNPVPEK